MELNIQLHALITVTTARKASKGLTYIISISTINFSTYNNNIIFNGTLNNSLNLEKMLVILKKTWISDTEVYNKI